MRKLTLVALVACLLAGADPVSAATVRFRTDEELIALSERVVRARPVARRTVWGGPQGRTIFTVTTLEILEDFTGGTDKEIEVWELGGVIGNQFMYVGGAVEYVPGQEVLVLLDRGPQGFRSVAMNFSKFEVRRTATDDGILRRNLSNTVVVGGAAASRERTLAEFRAVAQQVKGVPSWRAAAVLTEPGATAAEQGFTTLSNMRWVQADSATPVRWYKNVAAPPPLTSGDAVPEIMTSLAAWTDPVSATITLQYGGSTTADKDTIGEGNGVVIFEDPYNELSGSTLAVGGGFGFFDGSGGTFNGRTWNRFASGYVIFQNAADLDATYRSSLGFARILTHEIGHGIGLGHSDAGDTNIMYFACCSTATPVPPNLGADDLAGLNFIYPGGPSCTYSISPTSTTVPAAGGSGFVSVTAQAGCGWSAVSGSPFVTVTAGQSGVGNGGVAYSVSPNTSNARSGLITIAGQIFTVNQLAACSFTLSPVSSSMPVAGSSGTVTVTTQAGCTWTAMNNTPSFITITSPATPVTGSGIVNYSVAANGVSYRSGSMTIAGQTFIVGQLGSGPRMALNRFALNFGATTSGGSFVAQTQAQTVRMSQSGAGTVTWMASSNRSWLTVSPTSGTGPATFTISVAGGAGVPAAGSVSGAITVTLAGAGNAAGPVSITLRTYIDGASSSPFGAFDAPANNATGVTGSLPVTGWALDDVQVATVAIYRDAVSPEAPGLKFIGNAHLVDGARPDLAGAPPYAGVPLNTRAGWGYMMLTNMLPNRGNGTFVLHAYAVDREGRRTLLGSKTITCANSGAVKPFGAIDTPSQGETITGTTYNNFGWVLAPGAARADVPGGGSVTVFIDGVPVGSPGAWGPRPDISALFPVASYSGVNFAQAVYSFNPSAYADGVHTISWTVFDNLGNGAGLGSRYFTVTGGGAGTVVSASGMLARSLADEVLAAPRDRSGVSGRRGYDEAAPYRTYLADWYGTTTIHGEEIDRFELQLTAPSDGTELSGHLRVGRELRPLPIGSTLDGRTGLFTWQPGVGFIGAYDLVFVRWTNGRAVSRQDVRIVLNAKGSGHVGPQVVIDLPAPVGLNSSSASVAQPFVVAGWAADLDAWTGTGIGTLHVWAYPATGGAPIFLGAAAYGGLRPDVGAVYGEQFTDSGYGLIVRGLPPGEYLLAVFGYSLEHGGFLPAKTVHVTVRR